MPITRKSPLPEIAAEFDIIKTNENARNAYLRTLVLGCVAGMRSMTPFSLLDWTKEHNIEPSTELEAILASPATRLVTSLLASGELLSDKLPKIPARTKAGPFIGRLGVGALAGYVLSQRHGRLPWVGMTLGATGAAAGTLAGYGIRSWLAQNTPLPDALLGLAEDMLALGLGYWSVKENEEVSL
ncbi:hypothetical protein [Ktedonospora formicarum]|uniref:DUF4126 domain-containing protein n=1 Tax=Ktedonospora formicarum TaxID=2778364 RepID=A0A8J3MQM7_9CHLR|nr:hypothetical protein [Ktedonospora formicarum]GHO45072.1 hypothetical protein KSX_32350 [Ktedonospora formicarum]